MTSGSRRSTVSIEMRGYSGWPAMASTFGAAGDLDQIVDVRAGPDRDEIRQRAGTAADDEQHARLRRRRAGAADRRRDAARRRRPASPPAPARRPRVAICRIDENTLASVPRSTTTNGMPQRRRAAGRGRCDTSWTTTRSGRSPAISSASGLRKRADLRQLRDLRRKPAVGRDADDAIAEAEREQRLGDARRRRDDARAGAGRGADGGSASASRAAQRRERDDSLRRRIAVGVIAARTLPGARETIAGSCRSPRAAIR